MTNFTRKSAILYINKWKSGKRDDLVKNIGGEFYAQFGLMGFIKQGVTYKKSNISEPVPTWKITKLGEEQMEFYRDEPTKEEQELINLYESLSF